jgi:hypothetical protein
MSNSAAGSADDAKDLEFDDLIESLTPAQEQVLIDDLFDIQKGQVETGNHTVMGLKKIESKAKEKSKPGKTHELLCDLELDGAYAHNKSTDKFDGNVAKGCPKQHLKGSSNQKELWDAVINKDVPTDMKNDVSSADTANEMEWDDASSGDGVTTAASEKVAVDDLLDIAQGQLESANKKVNQEHIETQAKEMKKPSKTDEFTGTWTFDGAYAHNQSIQQAEANAAHQLAGSAAAVELYQFVIAEQTSSIALSSALQGILQVDQQLLIQQGIFQSHTTYASVVVDANGTFVLPPGDSATVTGTFTNNGTVTLNNNSTLTVDGSLTLNKAPTLAPGASITLGTSAQITVTAPIIDALISQFVTDQSLASSLSDQVNNIASAPNENSKSGKLGAFTHAVNAQTGKALTASQAALLIKLASAL